MLLGTQVLDVRRNLGRVVVEFFFGCGNSFLYGLNTLQQRAPLQETHAKGVPDQRGPHRPPGITTVPKDVTPRYHPLSDGLTTRPSPNMQTTCRPRPATDYY